MPKLLIKNGRVIDPASGRDEVADVLIKGADYAESEVVGHELVKSWGGEVKLAAIVEGYSTTAAIARMSKQGAA